MGNDARPDSPQRPYRFTLEVIIVRKKLLSLACLLFAISNIATSPARALDPNAVASIFERIGSDTSLADPAVIVIDEKTGEVVYEKNLDSPRKPASILKLLSATAAYSFMQPTQRFTTSVWVGTKEKSIVIQGSLDPWFSLNNEQAKKMGRTSLPRIEFNLLSALKRENTGSIRNSTIYYSNLYSQDIAQINFFFLKHGVHATFKRVSSQEALDLSAQEILTSDSPELKEILAFALTWSDNLLAERIARLASVAAGHPLDDAGVSQTFEQVLNELGIDASNLVTRDGSGLSRENHMTVKQAGTLLVKIHENPKFAPIVDGLPVGGISGTLRNRFLKTAPQAVGLIKAKTGRLRGTANLAGYIDSGDREYAFVIFADRLIQTNKTEDRARAVMDHLLGKVAFPRTPVANEQPQDQSGVAVTTTN
jgi:hypothetical protein